MISGVPYVYKDRLSADRLRSSGVSARGLGEVASTDLLRRLRDFAINDFAGERDFKGAVASAGDPPLSWPASGPGTSLESKPWLRLASSVLTRRTRNSW